MVQEMGIKKIGFFLMPTQGWIGGINYYKNLFQAINEVHNSSVKVCVFLPCNITKEVLEMITIDSSNFVVIKTKMLQKNTIYYSLWRFFRKITNSDFMSLYLIWRYKINIVSHSNFTGIGKINTINWIPDFQHLHYPSLFSLKEKKFRNKLYTRLINKSSILLVSSEDACRDLKSSFIVNKNNCRVLKFVASLPKDYINFQIEDFERIKKLYDINGDFFYLPNQFWEHKNHSIVIEALSILLKNGRKINIICSGSIVDYRNPEFFKKILLLIEQLGCKSLFKILGIVPYSDVFILIKYSIAVINPSKFEGWSSTVEECKSMGKKMLLSDIKIHKEQMPDAAFFNVNSPEELANLLVEYSDLKESVDCQSDVHLIFNNKRRLKNYGETYLRYISEYP